MAQNSGTDPCSISPTVTYSVIMKYATITLLYFIITNQ